MIYLYQHKMMKDLTNCYGFNDAQEIADKTDFEANYKASTLAVDDLELQENVSIISKTYAEFKALIDGVVFTWADVKLETGFNFYDLYLVTDNPL